MLMNGKLKNRKMFMRYVIDMWFMFQLPGNAPASVTLQPAPGDQGKVNNAPFCSTLLF